MAIKSPKMEVASEGERLGAKELWKAFDAAMNQAALARQVEALQLKGALRCKLLAPQGAGGRTFSAESFTTSIFEYTTW